MGDTPKSTLPRSKPPLTVYRTPLADGRLVTWQRTQDGYTLRTVYRVCDDKRTPTIKTIYDPAGAYLAREHIGSRSIYFEGHNFFRTSQTQTHWSYDSGSWTLICTYGTPQLSCDPITRLNDVILRDNNPIALWSFALNAQQIRQLMLL